MIRLGIDAWGLSGPLLHTGMGQYARHVIEGIARRDDFGVVAYGAPDESRPAWLPSSLGWRAPRACGPRKTAALATRMLSLRRAVADDGIDVFHAPSLHVRPSLPPIPSVACPLVATVHDAIPLTAYRGQLPARLRLFYAWNLRRARAADAVVTVSSAANDDLVCHARISPARVTAIANGVDFVPNDDRGIIDRLGVRSPYLLYAGSYEPRKNLRGALAAFARIARNDEVRDLVAIVERESGHAPGITDEIDRLGMRGRIHLVHSLSDAEVRSLYTHADALLFPSFAEGFGFPPLQAAACGVPVVASDIPAIRETMAGTARYVDPSDDASIAAGVLDVLGDASLRARLVASGRARAAQFTWDISVGAHAEVYKRLAAQAPPAPHSNSRTRS